MKDRFEDVIREGADEHGVCFYERYDLKGRVNGYTVEREDGIRGGVFHIGGRLWSGRYGAQRFEGTKGAAASWVLTRVANASIGEG